MQRRLEIIVEEQVKLVSHIKEILDDAAYAERFVAKPNNKRCPTMYKLLETHYDPKDWGYHARPKLVMRATPKQMTRYSFAIDILILVDKDISDNPILDRKLLWLRANRMKWTSLGKMFGYHRTTIKNRYEIVLDKLSNKLKKSFDNLDKLFSY